MGERGDRERGETGRGGDKGTGCQHGSFANAQDDGLGASLRVGINKMSLRGRSKTTDEAISLSFFCSLISTSKDRPIHFQREIAASTFGLLAMTGRDYERSPLPNRHSLYVLFFLLLTPYCFLEIT